MEYSFSTLLARCLSEQHSYLSFSSIMRSSSDCTGRIVANRESTLMLYNVEIHFYIFVHFFAPLPNDMSYLYPFTLYYVAPDYFPFISILFPLWPWQLYFALCHFPLNVFSLLYFIWTFDHAHLRASRFLEKYTYYYYYYYFFDMGLIVVFCCLQSSWHLWLVIGTQVLSTSAPRIVEFFSCYCFVVV